MEKQGAQEVNSFSRLLHSLSEREEWLLDILPMSCGNDECKLQYMGRACPAWVDVTAPGDGEFKVEVIDVWEMTRTIVFESINGHVRLPLPAKEGLAILLVKNEILHAKMNFFHGN